MPRSGWRHLPLEDVAGVVLLVAILATMSLAVFFRYVLNDSLVWSEEVSRYGLIYMTYLGCATAVRRRTHIRVDLVDLVLPSGARRILAVVADGIVLVYCVYMTLKTWEIMAVLRASRSTAMQIPIAWVYASLLVGFGLATIRLLMRYLARAGSAAARSRGE